MNFRVCKVYINKTVYLIKTAEVRQTRAGKDYLALTFQDDTGEIEGKVWDAQPGKIKDFTAGTVVHM